MPLPAAGAPVAGGTPIDRSRDATGVTAADARGSRKHQPGRIQHWTAARLGISNARADAPEPQPQQGAPHVARMSRDLALSEASARY